MCVRHVCTIQDMFDISLLGQYLVEAILQSKNLEVAFVWNRTSAAIVGTAAEQYILEDLSKFAER